MTKYKHIFFDLDRTLWDFERNSKETFMDIYLKYNLKKIGINNLNELFEKYQKINSDLWEKYRNGLIMKDFLNIERFYLTLKEYNIDDKKLASKIANDYVKISPTKTHLFPNAIEILEYLKSKNYLLHIITNGFPEVQYIKLRNANLSKYFHEIIISEEVGYNKPSTEIFEISLKKANAIASQSLMIGDDPDVDILGAIRSGIDSLWMNYDKSTNLCKATYELENLIQIKEIL
ncbi:MAG: noncanonical pyrimidine nucleotidase, YjjG family [Bacteroidetes bacterium CG2_30_33_31]|nr:MAG: noncanonical pyrimidine nucleotidase, YjjG family [Bacteroidetes bacterium CG2_30_33_31]